jgi:hypothetical protein
MKKRFFTLIEILIALFLIGTILTTLFRFFSSTSILEKKLKEVKEDIFFKNNLQVKFDTLFSKIFHKNFSKTSYFYTDEKNHLHFVFDNGIDPNPKFSSHIKATLFLNKNNELILKTMPFKKNPKIYREEILIKNVKSLNFEFFSKKDFSFSTTTTWPKKKLTLPAALKITINKNLSFAFFLPVVQASITYQNKKIL